MNGYSSELAAAIMSRGWAVICLLLAVATPVRAGVGFFAPNGIPEAAVGHTQIVLFNAENAEQVEANLRKIDGTAVKVFVDLGPIIAEPKDAAKIGRTYEVSGGSIQTKLFAPQPQNKLRAFPSDRRLKAVLDPVFDVMARHSANLYAVLPADEPYLNGITKEQLEHVGHVIRRLLDQHGLHKTKLAVVFASGMFNRRFAHLMNRRAGDYVQGIDGYYARNKATSKDSAQFASWVAAIQASRLTTYDQAGNMYVDGGLPAGYDVFGFDFYLSTLLLDGLHADSLSWFARNYPGHGCAQFAALSMSKLRSKLSFFHDGPVLQGDQYRPDDKRMLDAMYTCRMGAVTTMLTQAARGRQAQFLMISESSNNGVLEFDAAGRPESAQPIKLDEARVLDEVGRAEKFYAGHRCLYTAGLLFFTYADAYDASIKLKVGGAEDMPAVMSSIYNFARDEVGQRDRRSKISACPSH